MLNAFFLFPAMKSIASAITVNNLKRVALVVIHTLNILTIPHYSVSQQLCYSYIGINSEMWFIITSQLGI